MIYNPPDNLLELLSGVLDAAASAKFYADVLDGQTSVGSLEGFRDLPVTPLHVYRRQRLADVIADVDGINWIVGPHKGQSSHSVAVAEGASEGAIRYDVFVDAIKECLTLDTPRTCVVVTAPERRYFAAEVATILISAGIPSHVFTDDGSPRTSERLELTRPDIVVFLSDVMDIDALPTGVELYVTFRRSHVMSNVPQLDVYHVDELGFLGHSQDCLEYMLNRDIYYFETSDLGDLVVTALYNSVQPMLRVETADIVESLEGPLIRFKELSPFG